MSDILLTAINARYSHTSPALRCLLANMGSLKERTEILEAEISAPPRELAEKILKDRPQIIGFSCYIWNAQLTASVMKIIRAVSPETVLIAGGPEMLGAPEGNPLTVLADYIIQGEGEITQRELCEKILSGEPPAEKIIQAEPPDLELLELPCSLYTDEDIAHRVIYVETSRGCPYRCEYCISALDKKTRFFPLEKLLPEFETLIRRGVRHFKFLDRTFNLDINRSLQILEFFRERHQPGMMLHLEMTPERLPQELKDFIGNAPNGFLQFEIGVQTFNPETAKLIGRPLNPKQIEENLQWLRDRNAVHIHADLIAGLPGENLQSFAAGFDRLLKLGPDEIQVGILKKLRGAPIARHEKIFDMRFNPEPPYEILQTDCLSFDELQQIQRFARFYDLAVNSGRFPESTALILQHGPSPFAAWLGFSEYLYRENRGTGGIAPPRLARLIFNWLTARQSLDAETAAQAVGNDYLRQGRPDLPAFLKSNGFITPARNSGAKKAEAGRERQSRRN